MGYRSLRNCVQDLAAAGHLVELTDEVDATLEMAEIQRRVYQAGGPAILFSQVRGCHFPMVSNLFGTMERARFIFRDTWENVRRLIEIKIDPPQALRRPWRYWKAPLAALTMLPKRRRFGPVMTHETTISQLPQLKSWPGDAGGFVTLPQVYTESVDRPGLMQSNLGMYRVQLTGASYAADREIGLHYQIHRGIGVHHEAARKKNVPLRVNIFVGGSPAMSLAAVMPLPEGLSELTFAGALAGHRIAMVGPRDQLPMYGEADFCISGTVTAGETMLEGPFGDHLGYYSLAHLFPVMRVDRVYHRPHAIWPFTVVGRPPQEDTVFGELIHELTGDVIPTVLPGVRAVHAVDAAGVHPLLLAIGSERYTPYASTTRPQELLTQANAILGQGQLSLAKYLWIANAADDPQLDIHQIDEFFQHMLRRVDWEWDLHFQTRTTIDTLDYSGTGFNQGSKVVVAAAGPVRRDLPTDLAELSGRGDLPAGFSDPRVCLPGVLAIRGPTAGGPRSLDGRDAPTTTADAAQAIEVPMNRFCAAFDEQHPINRFPLVVIVDDSDFTARSLNNFLWVVFTRSNPANDIYGIAAHTRYKHWGCRGSLVIDARIKPHHAPPLVEDPEVTKKVDARATRGGPLARWL